MLPIRLKNFTCSDLTPFCTGISVSVAGKEEDWGRNVYISSGGIKYHILQQAFQSASGISVDMFNLLIPSFLFHIIYLQHICFKMVLSEAHQLFNIIPQEHLHFIDG